MLGYQQCDINAKEPIKESVWVRDDLIAGAVMPAYGGYDAAWAGVTEDELAQESLWRMEPWDWQFAPVLYATELPEYDPVYDPNDSLGMLLDPNTVIDAEGLSLGGLEMLAMSVAGPTSELTASAVGSVIGNPYYFTGRRLDILDGGAKLIQINRHRYYDYRTGRWLSVDPLGYVDGMNGYEYVTENPCGKSDPLGLICRVISKRNFPQELVKSKSDLSADYIHGAQYEYSYAEIVTTSDGSDNNWSKLKDIAGDLAIGFLENMLKGTLPTFATSPSQKLPTLIRQYEFDIRFMHFECRNNPRLYRWKKLNIPVTVACVGTEGIGGEQVLGGKSGRSEFERSIRLLQKEIYQILPVWIRNNGGKYQNLLWEDNEEIIQYNELWEYNIKLNVGHGVHWSNVDNNEREYKFNELDWYTPGEFNIKEWTE